MASDIDSQQDEQKITEVRKLLIKQKQQIQGYHIHSPLIRLRICVITQLKYEKTQLLTIWLRKKTQKKSPICNTGKINCVPVFIVVGRTTAYAVYIIQKCHWTCANRSIGSHFFSVLSLVDCDFS